MVRLVNQTRAFRASGHPLPLPALDVEPFVPTNVGANSWDLCLADRLLVYTGPVLDPRVNNPTAEITIPSDGYELQPGVLYLGATIERTECLGLVPWLEGKSSIGRLGIAVHTTAGVGDDGFNGVWTLEISLTHQIPVRIYREMPICQLLVAGLTGDRAPYRGKYRDQAGPVACRAWMEHDVKHAK
jgi:dCTP deaminase